MRPCALLALFLLSGCVVQKSALTKPNVLARFESARPVADFARCSAEALGVPLRNDKGLPHIILTNRNGVHATRWDFLTTLTGSQAELRSGSKEDRGTEQVRQCATL